MVWHITKHLDHFTCVNVLQWDREWHWHAVMVSMVWSMTAGECHFGQMYMSNDFQVADLLEAGSMLVLIAVLAIDGNHELVMIALEDDFEVLAMVEWHWTVNFLVAPGSIWAFELGVPYHTMHVDSRVEVQGS